LLASYGFPAEHLKHLRTMNVVAGHLGEDSQGAGSSLDAIRLEGLELIFRLRDAFF
jgi:hypothetical protein